ncbi:MAG: porin [Epsilonproteobacteria bacterium]|nr:hypothetical protein [Campylobacterota bacterium]NPA56384.1 porin [Campylobacterota bacterium]
MKKISLSLVSAMVLAAGITSSATAGALENIISNPKINLEIRPRYEHANVKDNGAKTAKGFTVRTALGLNAQLFGIEGLGAQFEAMNVANFGWVDKYVPEQAGYDVIADPSQTRVTQANVSFSANGFTAVAGRKMVVLDNARFIGNVGWRQMPQTYDLYAVMFNGVPNLSLLGAYVTRVHKVINKSLSTGSVLLHAAYKFMPELSVAAYGYLIEDFADHIGIRLSGKAGLGDAKVSYAAEYAKQTDPSLDDKTSGLEQDADYYNLSLGLGYQGFIAGIGYEVLGEKGDGDSAFYTPLATLHKFNGWADVFLKGTPDAGLCDLSAKLGYNFGPYGKLIGIYHKFESDKGSTDYGKEFDAVYKYKIDKGLGLLLKYARYRTDADKPGKPLWTHDVTKYWVQLDYKFSAGL